MNAMYGLSLVKHVRLLQHPVMHHRVADLVMLLWDGRCGSSFLARACRYTEVTDIPLLLTSMDEFLTDYNAASKRPMNLVRAMTQRLKHEWSIHSMALPVERSPSSQCACTQLGTVPCEWR